MIAPFREALRTALWEFLHNQNYLWGPAFGTQAMSSGHKVGSSRKTLVEEQKEHRKTAGEAFRKTAATEPCKMAEEVSREAVEARQRKIAGELSRRTAVVESRKIVVEPFRKAAEEEPRMQTRKAAEQLRTWVVETRKMAAQKEPCKKTRKNVEMERSRKIAKLLS